MGDDRVVLLLLCPVAVALLPIFTVEVVVPLVELGLVITS